MTGMKHFFIMILLISFAVYIENQHDSHPIYKGMNSIGKTLVDYLAMSFTIPVDHPATDSLIDALIESGEIKSIH